MPPFRSSFPEDYTTPPPPAKTIENQDDDITPWPSQLPGGFFMAYSIQTFGPTPFEEESQAISPLAWDNYFLSEETPIPETPPPEQLGPFMIQQRPLSPPLTSTPPSAQRPKETDGGRVQSFEEEMAEEECHNGLNSVEVGIGRKGLDLLKAELSSMRIKMKKLESQYARAKTQARLGKVGNPFLVGKTNRVTASARRRGRIVYR